MTKKWPRITAREMVHAVERGGFVFIRQKGSHKIFKNKEGRRVTIPFHAGKTLHPKILRSILFDAGWGVENLEKFLG